MRPKTVIFSPWLLLLLLQVFLSMSCCSQLGLRSSDVHLGALKTQVLENASTKQRISQGWKTHVRKTQVRICRDGKRKYGKCKYNANLQSDKKKFGTSQVSVVGGVE